MRPGSSGSRSTCSDPSGADVRLVHAGVRHHEPQPVRDDEDVLPVTDDFRGLREDDLDEPRILADFSRQLRRARARHDAGQIDEASFGFRDDLLRHDQDVAVRGRDPGATERAGEERGQIVAGLHDRQAGERGERHGLALAARQA